MSDQFWEALPSDSEMVRLTRSHPWHETSLGDPAGWPPSLRSTVLTVLECQLPMFLAWGDEFTQFYNDAYRPILGAKHPAALGGSSPTTWNEIWPTIGPMWQQVLAGKPIGFDDFKLTIERFGYPEDCYFNFSYSPVRDGDGVIRGVLVTFAETTRRVLAERRLLFLDRLATEHRVLSDPNDVMRRTAELLGEHLGANRCAYAQVEQDQDAFELIGDYNRGVRSIVGRYRFADFGQEVLRLMRAGLPYVNPDVDTDPATAGMDLAAYRATQIQAVICVPLHKGGRFVAAMAVHQATARRWRPDDVELVQAVVDRCWMALERLRAQAELLEEARLLDILNRTGAALSGELKLDLLLQGVTDAATELTGAKFGAFFYNSVSEGGESYMLYTLSGADRASFDRMGHPRPTALFGPTFQGGPPIRVDDVLQDERYGLARPHHGMPNGHLPVRSYLAVAVTARNGEVLGGLFFGHPEAGVFTEKSERLATGIASQAAIAIDNARLYERARHAAQEREALLESERAARAAAEKAAIAKDEFLATLSHELRTPLSAISGWVHILRRRLVDAPSEVTRGIDVIQRSTQAQAQLIDDLLDMSRIAAGKVALEMRPVSLVEVVQAAIDIAAPAAQNNDVVLVSELEVVPTVWGDASRLQQITWNLLINAVKFTPRGGEVRIRLKAQGPRAVLQIEDTGVGIATELLTTVFERFRQADNSTTRRYGGLGLGLSIVSSLVKLHGGTVQAHSEGAGRGAVFTVQLPTMDPSGVAGMSAAQSLDRHEAFEGGRLDGQQVLVVDDDDDVRELLLRLLQEAGAEVVAAPSAGSALQHLQARQFDVLISDIGMPEMDGYALLRQVRATPGLQALPAIALTAFAREQDRSRALAAGFDVHCAKPIDPSAVVQQVAALRDKKRQSTS